MINNDSHTRQSLRREQSIERTFDLIVRFDRAIRDVAAAISRAPFATIGGFSRGDAMGRFSRVVSYIYRHACQRNRFAARLSAPTNEANGGSGRVASKDFTWLSACNARSPHWRVLVATRDSLGARCVVVVPLRACLCARGIARAAITRRADPSSKERIRARIWTHMDAYIKSYIKRPSSSEPLS